MANMSGGDSSPHSFSQFTATLTGRVNCKELRTFPLPAAARQGCHSTSLPNSVTCLNCSLMQTRNHFLLCFLREFLFFCPFAGLFTAAVEHRSFFMFAHLFLSEREMTIFHSFFLFAKEWEMKVSPHTVRTVGSLKRNGERYKTL